MSITSKLRITGHCKCCGNATHYIDGEIKENDSTVGLYKIQWTNNKLNHPANLIVALIAEKEMHSIDGKVCFVLKYDFTSNSFMVVDHEGHPFGMKNNVLGIPLNRVDVVGKPISKLLFKNLDYIWSNDHELLKAIGIH